LDGTSVASHLQVRTIHVLIVDDDDDWRDVMADVLTEEGFSVSTASDGRAACASFQRSRPEVVVTDVDMPAMTGGELLAWLRSTDRMLPVIVVSGEDEMSCATQCPDAFRVIRKPATADAIVCAVREASLRRNDPLVGTIARAATALVHGARRRGQTFLSRSAQLFRGTKSAGRPSGAKRTRLGRARRAMVAGVGMAALAALAITTIRGLVA
jgi:DNA-binding NtrC family response regulator